jgi:predicted DNA-binding transcriptional regulator AlpA
VSIVKGSVPSGDVAKHCYISSLLNERQVASLCGISVSTIRRWRLHSIGPSFLKLQKSVRYRQEDVVGLLEECRGRIGSVDSKRHHDSEREARA